MIHTQVFIVGGGPVGMTLALALSKCGIASILVNDKKTTSVHPKLDVVNCRSMEIFRQLGIADKIRNNGNPLNGNNYVSYAASANGPFYKVLGDEKHLVYQSTKVSAQNIRKSKDGSLPLENMQRIPQMYLEPVLLDEIQNISLIEHRFGWRMFGFEQDESGVTALIQNMDNGKNQTIRADYIIGCDGAGSKVRNYLNIDYDGTRDIVGELHITHIQSDEIKELYPNQQPYWHTWICRPGFGGLLVSPDASRNDYILHRPFAPRAGENPEEIIESAIGKKVHFKIIQSGPWRPQFLVAKSFGRGRAFIAGDATHQYMPTGGLGMNTGVAEAHNLAWKLAAKLNGWGGSSLINSYEQERLPVAMRNRAHVKKCSAAAFEIQQARTSYMLEDTPQAAEVRLRLGDDFEKKITRLYESLGVEIGYRYESDVICKDDAPFPDDDERNYHPDAYTGQRLPNVFLSDSSAILDHISFDSFTLIVLKENELQIQLITEAAATMLIPLKVVMLNNEPVAKTVYQKNFILVRPDQHIAWRGDSVQSDIHAFWNKVSGNF